MKPKDVLIATLGVSPQVVTISVDLLILQGYNITELVTIYTDNEFVKLGLVRLKNETSNMDKLVHHAIPIITSQGRLVQDFLSEEDITAFLNTLYKETKRYKQTHYRLHLLMASGRKVMSAYVIVVAQLLFGADDKLWHLYSEFWQQDRDRKMHLGVGDKAILIPVPVLRWSHWTKFAANLALSDEPLQIINHQEELLQKEQDSQLRIFGSSLTRTQRVIIQLMAEGLDNERIAQRRGKSINTVTKQISEIYNKWRSWRQLDASALVRDEIVAEFAAYFTRYDTL